MASPSRVWAFSRTRSSSRAACQVARSTTGGRPGNAVVDVVMRGRPAMRPGLIGSATGPAPKVDRLSDSDPGAFVARLRVCRAWRTGGSGGGARAVKARILLLGGRPRRRAARPRPHPPPPPAPARLRPSRPTRCARSSSIPPSTSRSPCCSPARDRAASRSSRRATATSASSPTSRAASPTPATAWPPSGPWSSPYDRPVAATYAALTAAGAQRVVLLGRRSGAALALATAPALDPRPAGVVSLSAESTAGTFDAFAGVAARSRAAHRHRERHVRPGRRHPSHG